MSIGLLLRPERASRLVEYHARDTNQPGLDFVLDELLKATWYSKPIKGYHGEIRNAVKAVALKSMMYLVSNNAASEQARAIAFAKLRELKNWGMSQQKAGWDDSEKASLQFAVFQIEQFEANPDAFKRLQPLSPPDGSPIGTDEEFCSFQH